MAAVGLGVLATSFTSQAISTGFDRRYGVLCMLGLTPLGIRGLLAARTLVSVLIITMQIAILTGLTWVLAGWTSTDIGYVVQSAIAILLAVWGFTAGTHAGRRITCRSEPRHRQCHLPAPDVRWGLAIPLDSLPWAGLAQWLPTGALVQAMSTPPIAGLSFIVLLLWAHWGRLWPPGSSAGEP